MHTYLYGEGGCLRKVGGGGVGEEAKECSFSIGPTLLFQFMYMGIA